MPNLFTSDSSALGETASALQASLKPPVAKNPIIDISQATNSAQAIQLLEQFIQGISTSQGKTVDLNAGSLLLTRGVIAKINLQLKKHGLALNAVFTTVPQTQQAALDEGFFVKEAPQQPGFSPFEQLNRQLQQQSLTTQPNTKGVDLPAFSKSVVAAERLVQPLPVETVDLESLTLADISALLEKHQQAFQVDEIDAADLTVEAAAPVDPLAVLAVPEAVIVEAPLPLPSAEPSVTTALLKDEILGIEEFEAVAANQLPTLLVKQTLRSGQVLRYPGNITVVGDVHAGSEMTADGDILVWGEIRGIVHAGANGNYRAEIRAMTIEALQLRIADAIARRPDRIYYHKPQAGALPSPEVARVADGEIQIFKESLGIKS